MHTKERAGNRALHEIMNDMNDEMQQETQRRGITSRFPVIGQLSIALCILLLIFGATYIDDVLSIMAKEKLPAENRAEASTPVTEVKNRQFDDVEIAAESAYVWDVASQRALYNKNADKQLPLASITKLMTALVAYELLDPEERINISVDAIRIDGDSGFTDGESFSFRNLIDLTLISSSNDGAYALASAAGSVISEEDSELRFVDAMNIRAEEIGLSQTYFNNATGLDMSLTQGGAYGSARDMAFLMEYIITTYPELLEGTTADVIMIPNENGELHLTENTNESVGDIEGIIASKTGYTDLAGGNLVIAFNAGLNRPIIVSVLGSTREGRFNDALKLIGRVEEGIVDSN